MKRSLYLSVALTDNKEQQFYLMWSLCLPDATLLSFLKVPSYSRSCCRTCVLPQGSEFAPSCSWHTEQGLQQMPRIVQVISFAMFLKLNWKSWLVTSWLQTHCQQWTPFKSNTAKGCSSAFFFFLKLSPQSSHSLNFLE